jgi:hypothetical protein
VGNPLAKHVVQENTMINQDNPLANHVIQGNTMVNKVEFPKLAVYHVVLGNTMVNKANLVVHPVVLGNTKNKLGKTHAKHVPVVLTALLVR